MTQFKDLGLNASILAALTSKGYTQPTPIQLAVAVPTPAPTAPPVVRDGPPLHVAAPGLLPAGLAPPPASGLTHLLMVAAGDPKGTVQDPTITIHTAADPLVIVQNETYFLDRYRAAEAAKEPALVIQTVRGKVAAAELGRTLAHEHVLVDFIGAEQVSPTRYDAEEVFRVVLLTG